MQNASGMTSLPSVLVSTFISAGFLGREFY